MPPTGDADDTLVRRRRCTQPGRSTTLPAAEAIAYHVAAARELFEEAGVLLARHPDGDYVSLAGAGGSRSAQAGSCTRARSQDDAARGDRARGLRLALDALVLFAHWVTPPIDSRQFDTRFFMTRVPPHQSPAHDDTETTHSLWARPADAIAQAATRRNRRCRRRPGARCASSSRSSRSKDALAWARRRTVVRRMPKAIEQDGHRMLLLPGDPLHPDPAGDDPPLETRFVLIDRRWRAERPPA